MNSAMWEEKVITWVLQQCKIVMNTMNLQELTIDKLKLNFNLINRRDNYRFIKEKSFPAIENSSDI
jgi:hypothetical protein